MHYLIVLLLIIGVTVLMTATVLGISYGIGVFLNTRDRVQSSLESSDPCARCQADRDWYEELPIWKRNVVTAWWLANRYTCSIKGCR